MQTTQMEDMVSELPSNSSEKQGFSEKGNAKYNAVEDTNWGNCVIQEYLRLVMAIWPNLDSETKRRILTISTSKGKNTNGV